MIPRNKIDEIIQASRVEEVVGEFVTLKKRGVNYTGLCPFHNERTPSFTVSAVKGIYKCFGCGKAGNATNFIMEHLKLTYPDALKWLANKYNITVEERQLTPEEKEQITERESMLVVMQFAQRFFQEFMLTSDEGISIGLGYFKERGLREDIISKFGLGFHSEEKNTFSNAAVKAGYKPKYLVKTGMSILSSHHSEGNEILKKDIFDRFTGRIMFPVHDDGGRVVAFGGRTLSNDKKVAKYVNSPETDIYYKSRILYGLWFGKKAIQEKDNCYLVEGYMDVIAMHQSGIQNVVASSGTSLTMEQIKSIHRFTQNIVVLYDGDEAGQKASSRAIPLLLEEGMNVRLLFFPDGDDPDSFSRKVTVQEFENYIQKNTTDFLLFKANKLNQEAKKEPIKRAELISELVKDIALIPDNIKRGEHLKQCANIMGVEEPTLQNAVNRQRTLNKNKFAKRPDENETITEKNISEEKRQEEEIKNEFFSEYEERELLRIMLQYGNVQIEIEAEDENDVKHNVEISIAEFILFEMNRDDISFSDPIHQTVLDEYYQEYKKDKFPTDKDFANSTNPLISSFIINYIMHNYELSNKWERFGVYVTSEITHIKRGTQHVLFSLKEKKLNALIKERQENLKTVTEFDEENLIKEIQRLNELKARVNKLLGRIVVK